MENLTVGYVLDRIGHVLARYLEAPVRTYTSFDVTTPALLRRTLKPGDVLLVEGQTRIATAIKYLTMSTWSHSAFFIGLDQGRDLIEANLQDGVHYAPISKYGGLNTRICRPVGLDGHRLQTVVSHMRNAVGRTYDLSNIVDLARYLLPQPPVPRRWRRQMLSLGSGDPSRAICSTLIAEAFQTVRYPILPQFEQSAEGGAQAILRIRHHSLFVPRDFDLSPYFEIVKPTLAQGFDHRSLIWNDTPQVAAARPAKQD